MPTALAIGGFVALLALVAAALAAWLVGRLTDRVSALERAAQTSAEECRLLHVKLEAAATMPAPVDFPAPPHPPVTTDTGMNLSKRVQILRLHRRGESAPHIASVLTLPLAQVELVLKLQRQSGEAAPPIFLHEPVPPAGL